MGIVLIEVARDDHTGGVMYEHLAVHQTSHDDNFGFHVLNHLRVRFQEPALRDAL